MTYITGGKYLLTLAWYS